MAGAAGGRSGQTDQSGPANGTGHFWSVLTIADHTPSGHGRAVRRQRAARSTRGDSEHFPAILGCSEQLRAVASGPYPSRSAVLMGPGLQ